MDMRIYTDGGSRGNPGHAAIGVVAHQVVNNQLSAELFSFGMYLGDSLTNNEAEYSGVIEALKKVKSQKSKINSIQFFLDSLLVVNQLNGLWKMKQAHLRELLITIRSLEQEVGASVSYTHIPRAQNTDADALVNQALDAHLS
jgi:ribonuclease HI